MDTQQDILKWILDWYREDSTEEGYAYCKENVDLVDASEEAAGKTVLMTTVYKDEATGLFYRVTQCRDNCGYWGDGETYDPEIEQVWQIPVASWEYVTKDPNGGA